jgi:hypothetical protein
LAADCPILLLFKPSRLLSLVTLWCNNLKEFPAVHQIRRQNN